MQKRALIPLIAPVLALWMLPGVGATPEGSTADTPVIRITGEGRPKIPIAIPPIDVAAGNGALGEAAEVIRQVVRDDLDFSGYFFIVPEEYHALISPWNDRQGNYKEWLGIGAESLLVTQARNDGGREMVFEGRVFDTTERRMVLGKRYRGDYEAQRKIAHRMSNEIIQQYTGRQGVSLTRIAYVSETSRGKGKEIHVMDYDGSRVKRITANGSINISPAWSADGTQIAYVSYRSGTPMLMILSETGEDARAFRQQGELNSAPAWSPDGRLLAFSSSRDGNAEIYVMQVSSQKLTRLTRHPGIDTAPTWSPNGREIAFTSDRSGSPQIYVMDAEGANVHRITYDVSYCDSPSWSQHGQIAFTARVPGGFDIFVKDLSSGVQTQLTRNSGINETPRWSPDGRHLVFASNRTGSFDIYTMDADGGRVKRLTHGGNSYLPAWSR
ncbi:MAG TPA: Tol-Pal system beta propeller repeat protein TolB [Candidatus Polarisedimenticolia bacterium]|nr:Tol-Pal system beta propeller repeat protein TolB [Candidatus Polarisedimenticolia bacterium]